MRLKGARALEASLRTSRLLATRFRFSSPLLPILASSLLAGASRSSYTLGRVERVLNGKAERSRLSKRSREGCSTKFRLQVC